MKLVSGGDLFRLMLFGSRRSHHPTRDETKVRIVLNNSGLRVLTICSIVNVVGFPDTTPLSFETDPAWRNKFVII